MIELIVLMGLAWMLRNWLEVPTNEDVEDFIVYDIFSEDYEE